MVTVSAGSQRPSITSGAYATVPSPAMQISAKRAPRLEAPGLAPQSITRAPFDSVVTSTCSRLGVGGQPVGELRARGR